jgi:hypothetical protein
VGWAYPKKKSGDVRREEAESAYPSSRSEDAAASERVPQARPALQLPVLPAPTGQQVPRLQAQQERGQQARAQREQPVLRDAGQNYPMTK